MNIEKILKSFGLSDKGVDIYLCLLKSGPSPVRKIAKDTGINRGTTYDILKELIADGIVNYYNKDKKRYFVAESPDKYLQAISRKVEDLEKLKKEMRQIIPYLKSIYDDAGDKPVVKFYEKEEGIRKVLNDLLESLKQKQVKDRVYYVYSAKGLRHTIFESFPNFTKSRIKNRIKVKVVKMSGEGKLIGLDESRLLPKNFDAPTYIILYAGKVLEISKNERGEPFAILIEDKHLYKTNRGIFQFVWEKLRK